MLRPWIVLVDDDETLCALLSDLLVEAGYQVRCCGSSQAAEATIRRVRPDLVILDVWLESPQAGWRVLDALRDDPDLARVPVLITSADSRCLSRDAGRLNGGRCAVLEKPFDLDQLLAKVAGLIGRPEPERRPAGADD